MCATVIKSVIIGTPGTLSFTKSRFTEIFKPGYAVCQSPYDCYVLNKNISKGAEINELISINIEFIDHRSDFIIYYIEYVIY